MKISRKVFPYLTITILFLFPFERSSSAPVRITGNLTSSYSRADFSDGAASSSHLNSATINASSYIWQPWFALIDGNLSFSTNKQKFDNSNVTRDESLNGGLNLNVFPTSRFPFSFYTQRSQNEAKDQLLNRVTTTQVTGIKQVYKSRNGHQQYSGKYQHTKRNEINDDETTDDTLTFTGRFRMEDHSISSSIDYSKLQSPNESEAINYTVDARHSYSGFKDISMENLASSIRARSDFLTNFIDTENHQVASFLNWQPEENRDLNVTGNFLVSSQNQESIQKNIGPILDSVNKTNSSQMNINQGLYYRYTDNINLTQSFNLNFSETGSETPAAYSGSGGINYNSDLIETNLGPYSLFASSSLSHSNGDNLSSQFSFSNSLGHSLTRDFIINQDIAINSSFNQSFSMSSNLEGKSTNSLNHNLSLNWNKKSPSNNLQIRGSISDSRGSNNNTNQLVNLQVSDNYQYNRLTTFISSLTFQKSWANSDTSSATSQYSNGEISLSRRRFLNIRSLIFNSMLKFSHQKSTDAKEQQEDTDSSNTFSWENQLRYRVGLIDIRADLDFIKNDDSYNRIFLIQLTRSFGVQ